MVRVLGSACTSVSPPNSNGLDKLAELLASVGADVLCRADGTAPLGLGGHFGASSDAKSDSNDGKKR